MQDKILLNSTGISAIICLLILMFPLSPYVSNKMHIRNGKIFSDGFRDWNEKLIFYGKLNTYFREKNIKPKIILHYLQDKIFIEEAIPFEYDWYDYNSMKGLFSIMESNENDRKSRDQLAEKFLCTNDFKYAVLSEGSPLRLANSIRIIEGVQQSLYRYECSEDKKY